MKYKTPENYEIQNPNSNKNIYNNNINYENNSPKGT